jgi:hypothetical protein
MIPQDNNQNMFQICVFNQKVQGKETYVTIQNIFLM